MFVLFNFYVISRRNLFDFKFIFFVEKVDLFTCEIVNKNAVLGCLLQQANYGDTKRNLMIFLLENKYDG